MLEAARWKGLSFLTNEGAVYTAVLTPEATRDEEIS